MSLTIGKIAALSNVSVETIRYYQKIGLIKEPDKPVKGYRYYSKDNIRELKFIKKAQRLGFTLNEVAELFEIGSGKCSDIQSKARFKRDQISRQIVELQALERTLNDLIESCIHSSEPQNCPIIESLSGPGD
jgi:MerR family transcriptional regulator, mercuric resistance operon regulatory protein